LAPPHRPGQVRSAGAGHAFPPPRLVLFDRDGTLVHDVPYNGDPERVQPVPGAAEALQRLRSHGIATGMVSNQSGVARGLLTCDDVEVVSARVEELLGPFDTRQYCPHGPDDGCRCRKPAPGMVLDAAAEVGVSPSECAMVGDIGSDVSAALAAGARAILVPTPVTSPDEVAAAPEVAANLSSAVDLLLAAP
jgi:D-glycero-D-manno-heptose 1,7-bisphosphate phosphatase